MTLKVNQTILSVPPYLSTTWSRVASLHMKTGTLSIVLTDGNTIQIPDLTTEQITLIFHFHSLYLEKQEESPPPSATTHVPMPDLGSLSKLRGMMEQMQGGTPAVQFAFGSAEGFGTIMQHNPAQANAPDLPPDMLQKISAIANIIASPDELNLPTAELNCNCFHCQIARALNPQSHKAEESESVSDEELSFQQWDITQTGDQLFSVVNRLDTNEQYNVYLGSPVGCTCGRQGCEHILAVLKS